MTIEKILVKLLSDRDVLKLGRWNKDWIATYTIKHHTLHVKDKNLIDLLLYLLEWMNKEKEMETTNE